MEHYRENGYAEFRNFFSVELINEVNQVIDELVATLPVSDTVFDENKTGKIKQIQYLYKHHEIFVRMLDELRPIAEQLTETTDLTVLNMQLFEKHPKISKPTRAHQDNGYFKISPATAITFWIALDTIDEENGALYYAPKTHLTPTRKHQRYHEHTTFRVRSGVPGLSLCLHEHPTETDLIMEVSPGDVLAHHCNLIHRAGKNNSTSRRRRAIGVVFIPNACQKDPRLVKYHRMQLEKDIELQKYKDPGTYEKLMEMFKQ